MLLTINESEIRVTTTYIEVFMTLNGPLTFA